MKIFAYSTVAVVAIALSLGMLQTKATFAQSEQEYVSKAKAVTLHHAPLPGAEGKEVIIKHFTAPAGFVGGRHYHTGSVFVYVAKGELTIETEGGTQTFKAGELYPEPLNQTMLAKNLSASEGLELVVFQVGDIGKPMMVKAE
jgi:quercetin dioxygenase-like cupin family protein